jgi:flavin-dependent dehydrogenase
MHVRRGHYIGIAPLPGGLTNACVVTSPTPALRDPSKMLLDALRAEPALADRFVSARMIAPAVSTGPLAVECRAAGVPGLLLAGDAAGFIDPMTGDGLRFAFRGAELAAEEALRVLAHGWDGAHLRLRERCRREFSAKWRFNRTLRALVSRPAAVSAAAFGATLAPGMLRRAIAYAGDLHQP